MKTVHESINQMLPYGELLRGFASQSTISKGEVKSLLRSRGIFFRDNDKESFIPCLTTLLLSPSEFEELKEIQNTREDNLKKSSSRIPLKANVPLIECLPSVEELQESISSQYVNYKLIRPPQLIIDKEYPDKVEIDFELERYDLDKSWYESKNTFVGNLILEKIPGDKVSITKSYTSSESEEVANKFQNFFVNHLKKLDVVDQESELKKILFKDFDNMQRIQFFWRLTSKMDGVHFEFLDIEDIEFRPDESLPLPERIDWMAKKREMILKGSELHNTFFMKEEAYYPHLQFWGLEAKFDFDYLGRKGRCTVNFLFKDFIVKQGSSEFEINISSLSFQDALLPHEKNSIKQRLLTLLESRKNQIYQSFFDNLAGTETKKDGVAIAV